MAIRSTQGSGGGLACSFPPPCLEGVCFPENKKGTSLLGAGVPGKAKTRAEPSPMLCILQELLNYAFNNT